MAQRVVALGLWCAVVTSVGLLVTGSWPAALVLAVVAGAIAGHVVWLADDRPGGWGGAPLTARRRAVRQRPRQGSTATSAWQPAAPPTSSGRSSRRDRTGASPPRRVAPTRPAWRAPLLVTAMVLVAGIVVFDRAGTLEVRSPVVVRSAAGDGSRQEAFTRPFEDDPAFADAPWARSLRIDLLDAWKNLEFNAAVGGWSMEDVASEHINITDGQRATTPPPPSLGEPLTVWFFGGSAAFGAGQRDAHTIPSELVGLAADDDIPIEVHNVAVPATVSWQSASLLVARLAWDRPPDLVVFYDGANDLALQDVLAERGQGLSDWPASLVDGEVDQLLEERRGDQEVPDDVLPPGLDRPPDDPPSTSEAGRLVATRYGRGVELVQAHCAAAGVPVSFFWQPDLRLKDPLSPDDRDTLAAVGAEDGIQRVQTMTAAVRPELARLGVHDLSTVFDGRTEPIFWDTVHTNELGAQLVASEVYATLRPELARLHRDVEADG